MSHFAYRKVVSRLITVGVLSVSLNSVFAAKPIDLAEQNQQSISVLKSMLKSSASRSTHAVASSSNMNEISREKDFNQTEHIRVQQTYRGYPVLGGDAILHVAHAKTIHAKQPLASLLARESVKSNGIIYDNLDSDLKKAPEIIFQNTQAQKAIDHVASLYQKNGSEQSLISEKQSKLMVFVDKNQEAHWVYLVSFLAKTPNTMISKPTYLIDAVSLKVYQQWDDVQTLDIVQGGGFGGNKKTGMLTYDGIDGNPQGFTVSRDPVTKTCYLRDNLAIVRDSRHDLDEIQYSCPVAIGKYNHLYWNGGAGDPEQEEFNGLDVTNGGFSPSNDAYYASHIVKAMYHDWYNVDPITNLDTKESMKVMMIVHDGAYVNAGWVGKYMVIGDGDKDYYPLTTLDVIAHEVSHGFTQGHGVLIYMKQSGGINESFSDMAAQAAMLYATGKNNWMIGSNLSKEGDKPLRYMDAPTKDCAEGQTPGQGCSIDHMKDYTDGINVHYTSGIFNKAFYLISTSPNWDVKKTFGLMIHANRFYWTYMTDFNHAACGVLLAADDYGYDRDTIVKAFSAVGVETSQCK